MAINTNPCGSNNGNQTFNIGGGGCGCGCSGCGGSSITGGQPPGSAPPGGPGSTPPNTNPINPVPYPPPNGGGGSGSGSGGAPLPGDTVYTPADLQCVTALKYGPRGNGVEYSNYDIKAMLISAANSFVPLGVNIVSVKCLIRGSGYQGASILGVDLFDTPYLQVAGRDIPGQVAGIGALGLDFKGVYFYADNFDIPVGESVTSVPVTGKLPAARADQWLPGGQTKEDDPAYLLIAVCSAVGNSRAGCEIDARRYNFKSVEGYNSFIYTPQGDWSELPAARFDPYNWQGKISQSKSIYLKRGAVLKFTFPVYYAVGSPDHGTARLFAAGDVNDQVNVDYPRTPDDNWVKGITVTFPAVPHAGCWKVSTDGCPIYCPEITLTIDNSGVY